MVSEDPQSKKVKSEEVEVDTAQATQQSVAVN
jgi:hypothetical protein